MEETTEPVHRDVERYADRASRQDGADLVVIRQRMRHHDQYDQRDCSRQHVQLASLCQWPFEPSQPGVLVLREGEAEEQHHQECTAERRDLRMCVGDQRLISRAPVGRRVERQVEGFDRSETSGHPDDRQREEYTHAKHGNENTHREEDLLPELAHLLEDRGIDDRVVKRQRNLQDTENDAKRQSLETSHGALSAVGVRRDQCHNSHQNGNAKNIPRSVSLFHEEKPFGQKEV